MLKRRRTYLDWASAAPVAASARRAFSRALTTQGNPSSPHKEGRAAKTMLENARGRIARLAGTKPDAVIFTSGATEANALAIVGHVEALHDAGKEYGAMHVLYMPSAHASVIGGVEKLRGLGVRIEEMALAGGGIDLDRLKEQLTQQTVLVSVDVICGETGARFHVRDVRRTLDAYSKEAGKHITLHADASQAPRIESFELPHLGADIVVLDAQKIGAVRGIGCLIAPRRTVLAPLVPGGGQERGLRPGTESPALAQALATVLEVADDNRDTFILQATAMREELVRMLCEHLSEIEINEGREQAPHILNISLLGRDTDYLVALLDERGFAVSTKSACETDSTQGSRAVMALTGDEARARSTLRVSWGPSTRPQELSRFAGALIDTVRFLDAHAI